MSTSLSNESKNSLSITNENKSAGITWDEAAFSWDNAEGSWDLPRIVMTEESKNSISITNENKN